MYSVALSLLIIASAAQAGKVEQPKDLLCDICVDIVTDIDEWITSDSTMDDIIEFVEGVSCETLVYILVIVSLAQLCSLLSFDPTLEKICDSIIENNLPEIINGLVNDNLNPTEVCASIGMCSSSTTPAPTAAPARLARLQ